MAKTSNVGISSMVGQGKVFNVDNALQATADRLREDIRHLILQNSDIDLELLLLEISDYYLQAMRERVVKAAADYQYDYMKYRLVLELEFTRDEILDIIEKHPEWQ